MSMLTKTEKIELADAQVKQAEMMVKSTRKSLDEWIGVLELRQEYLEAITKVSDLAKLKLGPNSSLYNPPKQADPGASNE